MLKEELFPIPSTDKLFNHYNTIDPRVDLPDAAEIRRENLRNYIAGFSEHPRFLVVGEAPGPWGCRFSGVAFTSERQLHLCAVPFRGRRSSEQRPSIRLKKRPPYTSQSAEVFWRVMRPYCPKFFVWDCLPLYPHDPGRILSIRSPTVDEIDRFSQILKAIREAIEPRKILAVGSIAQHSLNGSGIDHVLIRHPAHGGAALFKEQVEGVFLACGS